MNATSTNEKDWTEREREIAAGIRADGNMVECRIEKGRRVFKVIEAEGGKRPMLRTVAGGGGITIGADACAIRLTGEAEEMKDYAARWACCLHEAGHVVTGRALCCWDTTAGAFVLESGRGGLAEYPAGLTPFAEAVVSAAGTYGERLQFEAPARRRRLRLRLPTGDTAEAIRARAVAEQIEPTREARHRRAVKEQTDAEAVAKYCALLHPTEPHEWRQTFDAVHTEARRVVHEHRHEIKRVAVELFHRGEITLPGDPKQDEFFAGGAVAAGE